jgi:hypothetical protein
MIKVQIYKYTRTTIIIYYVFAPFFKSTQIGICKKMWIYFSVM